MLTDQEKVVLETIIDKHGIPKVLESMSEICYEKSEHIQTNWQDAPLSKLWARASRALSRAVSHAAYQTLP